MLLAYGGLTGTRPGRPPSLFRGGRKSSALGRHQSERIAVAARRDRRTGVAAETEVKEQGAPPEVEAAAEEKPAAVEAEPDEGSEKHPLEPGGVRFEQVYREAKELKVERERLAAEKAQLEVELAAAKQPKPVEQPQPRQYTNDELDALEEDARARGDRNTVHAVQEYRIQRVVNARWEQQQLQQSRQQLHQRVVGDLTASFPALADAGSDLFKAAAAEFATLNQEYAVKGLDIRQDPHAAELAVGRAMRKDPTLLKKSGGEMAKAKPTSEADTHVETGEGGKPAATAPKGSKLSQRELDFCRRSGTDPKEFAKYKVERGARG